MKPSLEQLKEMRDTVAKWTPTLGTPDCAFEAALFPVWLARLDAQIAAEEAREKEWPQEGDECWWIDSDGRISHKHHRPWCDPILGMGLLYRTQADAELVRDFLRSRPRGWLLAMAKLGMPDTKIWGCVLEMTYARDRMDALTDDERAALLGQG